MNQWLSNGLVTLEPRGPNTCFNSQAKQTLANYYSIQSENMYYYLDLLGINHCQNHFINWGKNNYSTIMTNSVYIDKDLPNNMQT